MQKDSFVPTNQILALAVLATIFITCMLIMQFPPSMSGYMYIPPDVSNATSAPSDIEASINSDTVASTPSPAYVSEDSNLSTLDFLSQNKDISLPSKLQNKQ